MADIAHRQAVRSTLQDIRAPWDLPQAQLAARGSFTTVHCWEGGADSVDDAENVGGRTEAATRVTRRRSRAPTKPMEQMLWNAACFIRGEKDAAKGKDYRLPSLSLKHLSDVFDAAIDRLAKYGDRAIAQASNYTLPTAGASTATERPTIGRVTAWAQHHPPPRFRGASC